MCLLRREAGSWLSRALQCYWEAARAVPHAPKMKRPSGFSLTMKAFVANKEVDTLDNLERMKEA